MAALRPATLRAVAGDRTDVPLPSLLHEARGAYSLAMRRALAGVGLTDLPRNTAFVLGALRSGVPFEAVLRQRHRSLQRAGTIDALLAAGCLAKDGTSTVLTPKGEDAAAACELARREVDDALRKAVGKRGMSTMQRGLLALIELKERSERHA